MDAESVFHICVAWGTCRESLLDKEHPPQAWYFECSGEGRGTYMLLSESKASSKVEVGTYITATRSKIATLHMVGSASETE